MLGPSSFFLLSENSTGVRAILVAAFIEGETESLGELGPGKCASVIPAIPGQASPRTSTQVSLGVSAPRSRALTSPPLALVAPALFNPVALPTVSAQTCLC